MATRRTPKPAPVSETDLASDPLTAPEVLDKLWLQTKNDKVKLLILANPNLNLDREALIKKLSIDQHGSLNTLMPIAWFDTLFDNVSLPLFMMHADREFFRFLTEMAALRIARLAVETYLDYDHDSSRRNIARVLYEIALLFPTEEDARRSAFDEAYEVIQNGCKDFPAKDRKFVMVRKLGWCFKRAAEDGQGSSLEGLARTISLYDRLLQSSSEFEVVSRRFPRPTFFSLI